MSKEYELFFAGIVGAGFGFVFGFLKDFLNTYFVNKPKKIYSYTRLVCSLEIFFQSCIDVAYDQGEPSQNGCMYPSQEIPKIDFKELDIDWRLLSSDILYEVLNIPCLVNEYEKKINVTREFVSTPPEHAEYFIERRYYFASLGLSTYDLINKIKKELNKPVSTYGSWNPVSELKDIKNKFNDRVTG